MPEVQQETKESEGFYSLKIDIGNSTTSFNNDKSITLMSKDENCEKLLEIAKRIVSDVLG